MKKILAVLTLLLAMCCVPAYAEEADYLGKPFPDFTATDTEGNTFTLSEALKDHEAVLVNLWASWCGPCEMEMPYVNEAYEQYKDRVAFIALSSEPNDTVEKIEEYRQSHGLAFPMGREENAGISAYTKTFSIPTTVIVDRFGNAAFAHTGAFMGTGEITRTLDALLGEDYTETTVLTEIPEDLSTVAMPVSAVTAMTVENENSRALDFFVNGDTEEPQPVYVVYDDTARLRIKVSASADPATAAVIDLATNRFYDLADLADPQGDGYVFEAAMPEKGADLYYACIGLLGGSGANYELLDAVYLLPEDAYLEELADDFRSMGYEVSWEDAALPAEDETEEAAQAYILHVVDQDGEAVPGVMVNFCTDTTCTMAQGDEDGTILFEGEPQNYHVQLLQVPEGYEFDEDYEMYTGESYGEWLLRIRKR